MSNLEVLGKLCAGTVSYKSLAGGPSAGALTRAEMAGFLAGLSAPGMLMAQSKYMQDNDSTIRLYGYVKTWVNGVNNREGWGCNPESDRQLSRLASFALIEVVSPHRCARCHGVGFRSAKVCVSCAGTGYRPLSKLAMSKSFEVPETTFRRVWFPRFNRCVDWVRGFDLEVNRAVSKANWQDVLSS